MVTDLHPLDFCRGAKDQKAAMSLVDPVCSPLLPCN